MAETSGLRIPAVLLATGLLAACAKTELAVGTGNSVDDPYRSPCACVEQERIAPTDTDLRRILKALGTVSFRRPIAPARTNHG